MFLFAAIEISARKMEGGDCRIENLWVMEKCMNDRTDHYGYKKLRLCRP